MTTCTTLAFPAVVSCPTVSSNQSEQSAILVGQIAIVVLLLILVIFSAVLIGIFISYRNRTTKKGGPDQQNPP
jgi:heme/copper-type cytochrome/quinol oxidase subunit 2